MSSAPRVISGGGSSADPAAARGARFAGERGSSWPARLARGAAALALALVAGACGPAWGDSYLDAMAAGQRAYHAGRYAEAEAHYAEAVRAAQRLKDRDEAMLLVARMQERAGHLDEARGSYERIAAAVPPGPRRVRAAIAAAQILIEQGHEPEGYTRLLAIAKESPEHGDARGALQRVMEHERELGGDERVLAFLRREQPAFQKTTLAVFFDYQLAKATAETGDRAKARDLLVAHARSNPYPHGPYTDDALFRAAEIEIELGRPKEAVALLEEMLAPLEVSGIPGSYTRPRFPEGLWKIAEIQRDQLKDHAAARRSFHRLYSTFPYTNRRDDALWEEAKLAAADGDAGAACDVVETLVSKLPDSRYVRCAQELCKTARRPAGAGPCPAYILRELHGDEGGE